MKAIVEAARQTEETFLWNLRPATQYARLGKMGQTAGGRLL